MRIIAHRGASKAFHENTLAAFEQARATGADGIELDLRLTADRQWVVHHDAAIDIAGSSAKIGELRSDQIAQLWVGPQRDPVPTLTEILQWALLHRMPLVLDIKDASGIDELIDVVDRFADKLPIVYSSFRRSVLKHLREQRPQWRYGLIMGDPRISLTRRLLIGPILRYARIHHLHALHLHERWVSPGVIDTLKKSQINLAVWTVDDAPRMRMLKLLDVDAVITNDPETARRVADEKDQWDTEQPGG